MREGKLNLPMYLEMKEDHNMPHRGGNSYNIQLKIKVKKIKQEIIVKASRPNCIQPV